MEITQSELKKALHYCERDGKFSWRRSKGRASKGSVAGSPSNGYVRIGVLGSTYRAHRLVWLYAHGSFPTGQLDHINHIKCDNRLENLRDVTFKVNQKNKQKYKSNTTGVTGVSWYKTKLEWRSTIYNAHKQIHLGYFVSKFEAICARKSAENMYKYHTNHGI